MGMFLMPISNALADKCYSEYDCECCTQLFSSLYPGSATDISTVRMFMESAAGGVPDYEEGQRMLNVFYTYGDLLAQYWLLAGDKLTAD